MSSQPAGRPRPPSVERVLTAVKAQAAIPRDHEVVVEMARAVIADERERIGAGRGRPNRPTPSRPRSSSASTPTWPAASIPSSTRPA